MAAVIKTLLASKILRPDIAERRRVWSETRQPDMANMLERLVFIDETSLKTNLVKTTGWAPVGVRLVAPWVQDGAMNRASFDACIKSQLAPALRPGQIVVADNLSSHKFSQALELLRAQGNDPIFLPPYSPDPCVAKNSPLDCFLNAPHRSRSFGHSFGPMAFMPSYSQNSKP